MYGTLRRVQDLHQMCMRACMPAAVPCKLQRLSSGTHKTAGAPVPVPVPGRSARAGGRPANQPTTPEHTPSHQSTQELILVLFGIIDFLFTFLQGIPAPAVHSITVWVSVLYKNCPPLSYCPCGVSHMSDYYL
ncbi:hypothetical protein BO86DRAFT_153522 [Aspergillus japonicus CBS 114.51]|uniref:Uncharacterized protein n=1 Tax=Aspergillus japonicus CBS 114.51 TaxID=1448312 RepID=A0A8T8WU63_ASPJA|nr:hypothetical protein BO86DRAFT_153522 [Aspergillus japonicus CBS 114.51]RAH79375.1 hypothetical protein BO86DRAFT_153522 [Aspergillus japonicus CBS 114.51]